MKASKNILIVTPFFSPNLGGVETHLDDLCDVLAERDYKITVITYQPLTVHIKAKSLERRKNLTIYRIPWFSGNMFHYFPNIINFIYITPRLMLGVFTYLFKNHDQVDLIHAYGLNAAFIARFAKIFFKKKIIMSTEAVYNYQKKSIFSQVVKWSLNGFDRILAQSDASKEEMVRIGIDPDKIGIFHHWVNQKKFKPLNKSVCKKTLKWDKQFTALFVGRLIPLKGVNVFLEVARLCDTPINFKIIGDDGPELEKVKSAENTLNNLQYIGPVSYAKLPSFYSAADVIIYPALYKEDMSRVILESFSCGTPVINSNFGSDEYRLSKDVAIIVKPDPNEINKKLTFLYHDRSKWRDMVRKAPVFAKKFGQQRAQIIIDVYQNV